jgi:hypothetical protein
LRECLPFQPCVMEAVAGKDPTCYLMGYKVASDVA